MVNEWLQSTSERNVYGITEAKVKSEGVDAVGEDRRTLFIAAAAKGKTEVALALAQLGANVNVKKTNGDTALIRAVANGHNDTAMRLLRLPGVLVNEQSQNGRAALHFAVKLKNVDIVDALLATPGIEVNEHLPSALWIALQKDQGPQRIVNALIGAGAVNVRVTKGTLATFFFALNYSSLRLYNGSLRLSQLISPQALLSPHPCLSQLP
jgi:ankyrin repeat protein